MDLTFYLSSPTYSRKSIQQLSHLYHVSAVAFENRYIISILEKKKWPVSPHFPSASAPLLCSHFISWKSCLYMIMPLLPFFPEPSPVSSWKQPLSSPPITSVFPRFNDYLSSHATYVATSDTITPSLTDFHDMAFRILLSGFSFTGHCFSISFETCFWLPSPWTFINTYAHSLSGQPHPCHSFKIISVLAILKLMFPTKTSFMNLREWKF